MLQITLQLSNMTNEEEMVADINNQKHKNGYDTNRSIEPFYDIVEHE